MQPTHVSKHGHGRKYRTPPQRPKLADIERFAHRLTGHHLSILKLSTTCDYAGLAQELEIAKGTVKSRLFRAREALDALIAAERAAA